MKLFFEGTPEAVKAEMAAFFNLDSQRVHVEPELASVPKDNTPSPAAPAAPVPAAKTQQPAPAAQPAEVPTALFPPAPEAPSSSAPAAASAPVSVVPAAPAKKYSLEDLLTAAAPLMDQGKFTELTNLTAKYGVKSFTDIPEAQYGNVAVDLRALGAQL